MVTLDIMERRQHGAHPKVNTTLSQCAFTRRHFRTHDVLQEDAYSNAPAFRNKQRAGHLCDVLQGHNGAHLNLVITIVFNQTIMLRLHPPTT
jgi:hypothetical protein